MKRLSILAAAIFAASAIQAQIPLDYYSSLQGLSGKELKDAIHTLVNKNVSMLSYGSGNNKTWWGFYVTDRRDDNSVVDRYSYEEFYFGDRGKSVTGMNIEHSFPKSWWGGTENNAYKDLFNLMPCESSINQAKSNYPMGQVNPQTATGASNNGCTMVGRGYASSNKYWEPADEWKGDFSRGYFYMATAYQDLGWTGTQALQILSNTDWQTLQPWAYELYLDWARRDRVDEIETVRCDRVETLQHNRNPYVDFPNLMEYVWGDSTHIKFDPVTSVKSTTVVGGMVDPEEIEIYASTFLGETGNCTVVTDNSPGFDVWVNKATYGWCASAFKGSNKASDATLLTPEIDLTGMAKATLNFEHAVNFADSPESVLSVSIVDANGNSQPLSLTWPGGSNWTFKDAGPVSLNPWCGKRIHIAFRYTSTTDEAATWEIKNMSVTGHRALTALPAQVYDDAADSQQPAVYYDLRGIMVDPATYRGIAIRRQGAKATKVLIR